MKTTNVVLLFGLLLCGCSQKQAASANQAIKLVQVGKDSAWHSGAGGIITLHVAQRQGDSIHGIQLLTKAADGTETSVLAETGTVAEGPDQHCVRVSLYDAKTKITKAGVVTQEWTNQEVQTVLRIPGQ
jgi:hypothetical protein